jgi:hypothetical protein
MECCSSDRFCERLSRFRGSLESLEATMVRWLAVGFVLVTTAVTGAESRAAVQLRPSVYLVKAEPLVENISVSVIWVPPDLVSVQVHKGSSEVNVSGGHHPKAALDLAIQAWVLKSDGTALSRRPGPGEYPGLGRPDSGSTDWSLLWAFEYAERNELAGIVVRVGGTFFVRPIPQVAASR